MIGEEIYDEFDPQGARGDPYEVPEKDVQPPETMLPKTEASIPKINPSLPILMPTALRNFGGLGFLRSRSAPPIPRDVEPDENNEGDGYVEPDGPMTIARTDVKIEMPKPAAVMERHLPSIMVEPYDTAPEYSLSQPIEMSPGIGVEGTSKSLPLPNTTTSPVLPVSRTTSPAPLEAVLLDRKRRLIGTAGAAPSAVASTASLGGTAGPSTPTGMALARNAPSVKGTRFKSSPLGGLERAGVVVAEKVKEGVDDDVPDEGKTDFLP